MLSPALDLGPYPPCGGAADAYTCSGRCGELSQVKPTGLVGFRATIISRSRKSCLTVDPRSTGYATIMTNLTSRKGTLMSDSTSEGTKASPWQLRTPPGTSEYTMYLDDAADPPSIVCQVGGTQLRYQRRAIDDLHAMLKEHGDWMPLGGADEQKPAPEGSVEAWGRSADNPVGGWYGLKKGLRGRFGVYMPPLLEALGLAEVTHDPKGNKMRAR